MTNNEFSEMSIEEMRTLVTGIDSETRKRLLLENMLEGFAREGQIDE